MRQDDAGEAFGEPRGYAYRSFDDAVTLGAATADPLGFVADLPEHVILDEVQRAPALFTAIKASVDRKRDPGRFLLTGSANVLLFPKLADSLAGRLEILRLHPLAQCELAGDEDGAEVDLVLERGGRELAGVEVKAAATVTTADFRGLRKLQDATGKRFAAGVVLYDGEDSVGFGEGFFAVPVRALWELKA